MRAALVLVVAAGCNQILGNSDFHGGGPPADARPDACVGPACPTTQIDAMQTCELMQMPPTTIEGTVFMPNGTTPLPGVTVYVPKTAPDPMPTMLQCGCVPATGGYVVKAITDSNGHFSLPDAPGGANVPLVLQLGKWRRQLKVATVAQCATTTLPSGTARLPRNANEGDLPKVAISTGSADSLECLIKKIGVDDVEVTDGSAGHIHLYTGQLAGTTMLSGGTALTPMAPVTSDIGKLGAYDDVLMSCEGGPPSVTPQQSSTLVAYANMGGRVVLEHFHNVWIRTATTWSPVAMFDTSGTTIAGPPDPANVRIDQGTPQGTTLAAWLLAIAASTSNGQIVVNGSRATVISNDLSTTTDWASLAQTPAGGNGVQIFSFATPLGATPSCGRVVFSDMHESGASSASPYPSECPTSTLSPQEDVLAFLFFDQPTCPL